MSSTNEKSPHNRYTDPAVKSFIIELANREPPLEYWDIVMRVLKEKHVHVTKNAVAGIITRARSAGLVTRQKREPKSLEKSKKRSPVAKVVRPPVTIRPSGLFQPIDNYTGPVGALTNIDAAPPTAVTMNDMPINGCLWPYVDAGPPRRALYCGQRRVTGRPFCDEHCARAYRVNPHLTTTAAR